MSFHKELHKEVLEALVQQDYNMTKLDTVFINIAKETSTLSHCVRSKVGAVLVKNGNIISFGYNGTPSGMDNACEKDNVTLAHVIHAECNAILKAAKTGNSVDGSTLYLTLSPCLDCSKLILQSGIKRVVYLTKYRNSEGIDFLNQFIQVEQYDL
jgi:dCMP deaminase